MPTLMLTWNPAAWPWPDFRREWQQVRNGTPLETDWKCKTSAPREGDRFFLVLQGTGKRGIVASGTVRGEPYYGRDPVTGTGGAQLVPISFDVLLDPNAEPILDRDELLDIDPRPNFWGVAHSGSMFDDDTAARLEKRWARFLTANDISPAVTPTAGTPWTSRECASVVADYFDMLRAELLGQPYSKADHRRRLQERVKRSTPSIEYKHANISAVLVENAQPYIDGYKPRGNYQRALADAVETYLDRHPDFFTTPLILAAIEPAQQPAVQAATARDLFDAPPEIQLPQHSQPWRSRRGRKIDFAMRDAANRQLGRLGEEFAVQLERRRLAEAGRDDLAARVEWIAQTCGDGVGYDVLSFDEQTEAERWLEVKTTGLGKYHTFLVTDCEVRCSEAEPERFNLYRVYDFRIAPRVYVLAGAITARCEMQAALYRAAPQGR